MHRLEKNKENNKGKYVLKILIVGLELLRGISSFVSRHDKVIHVWAHVHDKLNTQRKD